MSTARSIRVQLLGSYTAGAFMDEIWQTGFSCVETDNGGQFAGAIKEGLGTMEVDPIGATSSDATWDIDWAWEGVDKCTQANQVGIANLVLAWWNGIKANATTGSRLDAVKISAIDSLGKVINGGNYFSLKTPVAGTGNIAGQIPAQLAVVMSLRTGGRGPGARGRMYLPLNNTMGNGGVVPTTLQTGVTTAAKTMFEGIRAIGPLLAVVNQGPLTYSSVGKIQIGNLYDTQRRRRNAIPETFTEALLSL